MVSILFSKLAIASFFSKISVSGVLRYLGSPSPSILPPTHFSSSYPYRELFGEVLGNLRRAAKEFARGVSGEPVRPVAGVAPGRLAVT